MYYTYANFISVTIRDHVTNLFDHDMQVETAIHLHKHNIS
jgi:hypothetical protein